MDFVRLTLQDYGSRTVSVITQQATADFFGWSGVFPEWSQKERELPDGSRVVQPRSRSKYWWMRGGRALRICRSPVTTGHPAGLTHSIRMKGAFTRKHQAALAAVAGERFEWMESREGLRLRREVWLDWAD